ncbi:MAG: aldo/keto reductase [Phycisphaerales bacterium]
MELRSLGSTGLRVGVIGLGTVKLGRNRGVKYPGGDGFLLPTDEEAAVLFRTAAGLGINLIDTAPAYGTSEERIGTIMSANRWFGGRDRWVVCGKAGEEFDTTSATSRHDFAPAAIAASVERSLRRLRIERLDLLLLHSDGRDGWIINDSGAVDALERMKERGDIGGWGLSAKTAEGAERALERGCDALMVALNAGDTTMLPVIEAARSRPGGACAVLIKKALESGRAIDAAAAVRFALAPAGVSSVIIGTLNPAHLRANAAAAG